MKYSAIVTFHDGTKTGATITADSTAEAWTKLFDLIDPEYIGGATVTQILTPERGGE